MNCGKTSSNDTPAVCMRMMPLTPLLLGKNHVRQHRQPQNGPLSKRSIGMKAAGM
ncbi:MAG: hypothetical protein L6V35_08305 [Alistipes putredinis]|nr:MAG: hypothetical protein L6V35_08305 [Alistipes putredinis]